MILTQVQNDHECWTFECVPKQGYPSERMMIVPQEILKYLGVGKYKTGHDLTYKLPLKGAAPYATG